MTAATGNATTDNIFTYCNRVRRPPLEDSTKASTIRRSPSDDVLLTAGVVRYFDEMCLWNDTCNLLLLFLVYVVVVFLLIIILVLVLLVLVLLFLVFFLVLVLVHVFLFFFLFFFFFFFFLMLLLALVLALLLLLYSDKCVIMTCLLLTTCCSNAAATPVTATVTRKLH